MYEHDPLLAYQVQEEKVNVADLVESFDIFAFILVE